MNKNIILSTDTYKAYAHWNMMPEGTTNVFSYFEARKGAKFPETVFFGLQYILKEYLVGQVVTREAIEEAAEIAKYHVGNEKAFNRAGWEYILNNLDGYLPLKIKAVKEGTSVPVDNILMSVVNTDPNCYWLTNYVEGLLSHVWASSTVATLAKECKKTIKHYLDLSSDNSGGLDFMLHCFGYRSVSSEEGAGILGLSNLTSFKGTDTLPAIRIGKEYYGADYKSLAFSVPASEHSISSSVGRENEGKHTTYLLNQYPTGILSLVADTYDYYNFVSKIICTDNKELVLNRNGVTVIRPDSITPEHSTPESLTLWTFQEVWNKMGGTTNSKGFKVINKKISVLWGDGIDKNGIQKILQTLVDNKFSVESVVFGMGGNYLQKGIYRDLQRFAFKCSAQRRNGEWLDIFKSPKDQTKASKKGILTLVKDLDGNIKTCKVGEEPLGSIDMLETVYYNGNLVIDQKFEDIRRLAAE